MLRDFVNVREIRHVVCADGLGAWHCASEERYWPCGVENLCFVNPDDSSTVRSIEVDAISIIAHRSLRT